MTRRGAPAVCKVIALLAFLVLAQGVSEHPAKAEYIALVGATVYRSPGSPPLENAVLLIAEGRISAVGPRRDVSLQPSQTIINVEGKTVVAGLWNSHVHFRVPPLETASNGLLVDYIRDMLLQYGFVHVLDTGSGPGVSVEIRRRIEAGEMPGPSIRMANGSLVPQGASPFYVRPAVLPDVAPPDQARQQVDLILNSGAEGIKLFSGSIVSFDNVVPMNVEMVRGIADAAHERGAFVVAHPTNNAGAWAAIKGGVDILAHTFPQEGWDRSTLPAMLDNNMALIPTLKLWRWDGERFELPEVVIQNFIRWGGEQIKAYADMGGEVMFGTDVGYMTDFDPADEYTYMLGAGLTFEQILSSLTTTPARRFGLEDHTGRIEVGFDADLVVLTDDPVRDITAFARPELVMRQGKILFRRAD